jgi:hypothetical protein
MSHHYVASNRGIEDVRDASPGRGRVAVPRLPDRHRRFVALPE